MAKVILLQDVEKLGKKNDVKNVNDGYARNFLFPKKLAKLCTKKELEILKKQKEIDAEQAKQELEKIQELVSKIDGQEIEIFTKIDENGNLYGSINESIISEELKKRNFDINKKQIKIPQPIKAIGEYPVIILFDHKLEAEIKVIISEKEEEKTK